MTTPGFLDFEGRTVVVTGASQGLGRACAELLSAHGARVVLIGRSERTLADVRSQLAGDGHQILSLDLMDLDRIAPAIAGLSGRIGRLYGLCHAAGIVATHPVSATLPAVVHSMMTVNLFAGLELARCVARRDVMEAGGGSLLFISSVYASAGVPGQMAYSASKGGLNAAARSMSVEFARRRVRVNTLSPGLVRTAMTENALAMLSAEQVGEIERKHPLGMGTPVDVARAAIFLLAPATAWITGINLVVDGGYSAQ